MKIPQGNWPFFHHFLYLKRGETETAMMIAALGNTCNPYRRPIGKNAITPFG